MCVPKRRQVANPYVYLGRVSVAPERICCELVSNRRAGVWEFIKKLVFEKKEEVELII